MVEESTENKESSSNLGAWQASGSGNEAPAVEPASPSLDSGHSFLRKIRFSGSLSGTFVSSMSLSLAREIYTLMLGVRPKTLGPVLLVASFIFPFCAPAAGYVMDKYQLLGRCFPLDVVGRRAPWFAVHLTILAICGGVCYLPPTHDNDVVLVTWLVVVLLVAAWSSAVVFAAFESARQEIYPMKEERILVESMTKVLSGFGVGIGSACGFLLVRNSAFKTRLGASAVIFLCTLLSLEAVPVLQDAHVACDLQLIGPLWREWQTMLSQSGSSLVHYLGLRFWQGALEATLVTFSLYYLAVVSGVTGEDRQNWLLRLAVALMISEGVCLLVFTAAFKYDFLDMQRTCGFCHAVACVLCPVLLKYLPLDSEWCFMVFLVLQRLSFAPQTWFRANAFCWIVDEDCLSNDGKRREATYAGLCNFIGGCGRASAAGFLYIGMSEAGLNTKNCSWYCNDDHDQKSCVKACEVQVYASQPESVRDYIRAVYTYIAPVFQVLCALHITCFPIRGQRLHELCERQSRKLSLSRPSLREPGKILGKSDLAAES